MADPTEQIPNSILHDIKQLLGQEWDDNTYDLDIKIHINATFFTLHQLGVGPSTVYSIQDHSNLWPEFTLGKIDLEAVKTYVYMQVRMLFDPPTTGPLMQALERQIDRYEWRLMVANDPDPNLGADIDDAPTVYFTG